MKNRSEEIVELIGKKIVCGDYPESYTLPKMELLGEEYGVSRTVIREALQVLSRIGMVESIKKSGTVVLHKREWHWWDQQVLQWVIDDINVSGINHREFILHLTEMRLSLEPMAVYLAAERATTEDLQEIENCVLKLEQAISNLDEWAVADYKFHLSLVKASHNHLMVSTLTKLNKPLILSRKKTYGKLASEENRDKIDYEIYKKHLALYEAVAERNGNKAKRIAEELLTAVYELIKLG